MMDEHGESMRYGLRLIVSKTYVEMSAESLTFLGWIRSVLLDPQSTPDSIL